MAVVLVSGALANKLHNGGAAWTRLSWALGLKALGLEVAFVEQIRADCCVDASGRPCTFEESANREYFREVTEQFGLSDLATLTCDSGPNHGLTPSELDDLMRSASALVNITGHWTHARMGVIPRRIYIDLDPGYTQFWHAAGNPGPRLEGHNFYYTVGENIGRPGCSIPTGGISWRPIRQPVVLELWPACATGDVRPFSTIASWRGPYGPAQYAGTTYGLKAHEFRKFVELPRRVDQRFEIALDIDPADERDRVALRDHGWHVVDPGLVASGPVGFREYVQTSGAEFSVAQGIYVETQSGWFSDRTVRYLASGRPALVQDTGFSRNYPLGEGLVAFRTLDEAVTGALQIARDYENHCRAARAIAESYFDSDRVLGQLVDEVWDHASLERHS
jgi:hypothetical protein